MNRWLVAIIAALCTTAAFRLYSHLVVPLTIPKSSMISQKRNETTDYHPPMFVKVAREHFADVPWTAEADVQWQRSEQAFLFAENLDREKPLLNALGEPLESSPDAGKIVKAAPFAMLWKDPRRPQGKPFRIVADAAILEFENAFLGHVLDLVNANPGRIVGLSLEGRVRIDGPDGLEIVGSNFKFSEESYQLYSDEPVKFQYGPSKQGDMTVAGSANRVVLNMLPALEPELGKDMPRVAGIERLRLSSNVNMQFQFAEKGRPVEARIACRDSFEYNFVENKAAFADDVQVRKFADPTQPETATDWLLGDFLEMQFASPGGGNANLALFDSRDRTEQQSERDLSVDSFSPSSPLDALQLQSLNAFGRVKRDGESASQVHVHSGESVVDAFAHQMSYNAVARTVDLIDPLAARVENGSTVFLSPRISIRQSPDGNLERLLCTGRGKLFQTDKRWGEEPLEATWEGAVDVQPEPGTGLQVVTVLEQVRLLLPHRLGIAANEFRIWIDPLLAREAQGRRQAFAGPLPVKRVDARDQVRLISSDLHVERADSIRVVIKPGQVAPSAKGQPSILQAEGTSGGPASEQRVGSASLPWIVDTDALELELIHDETTAAIDLRNIHGPGMTRIGRTPAAATDVGGFKLEGTMSLIGRGLQAVNEPGSRQTLSVDATYDEQGNPTRLAELSLGGMKIEGARLRMDRAGNSAGVAGPGRLTIPVNEDLEGKPLEQPALLTVTWLERMDFDGQSATFFEGAKASLQGHQDNVSTLTCAVLRVDLNRRIQFTDERPETRDLTIQRINGRHAVKIDSYEWTGTQLTGKRLAQLAEFDINLETGEFTGQGPGIMDIWTLGSDVRFSPSAAPEANRPADTTKPQWRYTNVVFADRITGNLNQKQTELQERVRLVSAPVENANAIFDIKDLDIASKQSENAALLNCDRLRLTQRDRSSGEGAFFEILAYDVPELESSVTLEGHRFRATSNELSFDEQSETFVLRGHGQFASLYFMDKTGQWQAPSPSRHILFNPASETVRLNETTGARSGF